MGSRFHAAWHLSVGGETQMLFTACIRAGLAIGFCRIFRAVRSKRAASLRRLRNATRHPARACCHRCTIPVVHGPLPFSRGSKLASKLSGGFPQLVAADLIGFLSARKTASQNIFLLQTRWFQIVTSFPTLCSPPPLNRDTTSGQPQNVGSPFDCCSGAAPMLARSPPRHRHSLAAGS